MFYSQDRLMREQSGACHINAGFIEVCREKISLDVVRKGAVTTMFAEKKLDTCGSVSLAHSSIYLRRDNTPCQKYDLKAVALRHI